MTDMNEEPQNQPQPHELHESELPPQTHTPAFDPDYQPGVPVNTGEYMPPTDIPLDPAEVAEIKVPPPAKVAKLKKPKKRTKGEELQDAAQEVLDAIDEAEEALQTLIDEAQTALEGISTAYETLKEVRDNNYSDWNENLPENLRNSALGEKLQTLMDIDLEPSVPEVDMPDFEDLRSGAQEILDAELPLGFGRD